tara:strand:- start:2454 stop:3479 length:1026 start_codon:yes stop_codon:yes gene_type:complete
MSLVQRENYKTYVEYFWPRAKWLEDNCHIGTTDSLGKEASKIVNDPLMQNGVYNSVSRWTEGFNYVLEDLQNKENSPQFHKRPDQVKERILKYKTEKWTLKTWIWTYIFHRATGSGFSGTYDHGYRNSIVTHFGKYDTIDEMIDLTRQWKKQKRSMNTSVGNIPPHPRKGQSVTEYMCTDGVYQAERCSEFVRSNTPRTIRRTTNFLNEYHLQEGIKRWNFPFAMASADIAHYHPNSVDPNSMLMCGSNARDGLLECFERPKGMALDNFTDAGLIELSEKLGTTPAQHEDTLCIFIRFLDNVCRAGPYKNAGGFKRLYTGKKLKEIYVQKKIDYPLNEFMA